MKQPELGEKISQLRKSKGWTQEELVEKCNISVRTIQRVEAGEVTPRYYTIRTILHALEYELEEVQTDQRKDNFLGKFQNWNMVELDAEKAAGMTSHLMLAWIMGAIFFVIEFFDTYIEYVKYDEGTVNLSVDQYLVLKAGVLLSFLLFMRGFVLIGELIQNYLLKIAGMLQMGMMTFLVGFDLLTFFNESLRQEEFIIGFALTQGVVMVFFGYALYRSENELGPIARYTGILEIITGICFATVLLSIFGLILLIPVELMEIIILFKTMEMFKENRSVGMG